MAEPAVVRMANDIARQFAHYPPDAAAEKFAGHLQLFWDPRMRRELRAEIERDPEQLSPLVISSLVEPVETP